MKKKYTFKTLMVLMLMFSLSTTYAQTELYYNDFEGADYDTYTLNDQIGLRTFGQAGSDYVLRSTTTTFNTLTGNPYFGFTNNFIALEDFDAIGFLGAGFIETAPIDITGATGLNVEIRIAAARGNDGFRYESTDRLQVQTSIDGAPFTPVISCTGDIPGNGRFYYDSGNDGVNLDGNDILVDNTSQFIVVPAPGAGLSLRVKVVFESFGSHEEMAFDDLRVTADNVLGTEEETLSKQVSIFPNPLKNDKVLHISNTSQNIISAVEVYNVIGKKIFTETVNTDNIRFAENMPTGVYFVKITDSKNNSITKKIMIQ